MNLFKVFFFLFLVALLVAVLTIAVVVLYTVATARSLERLREEFKSNPRNWKADEAARYVKDFFKLHGKDRGIFRSFGKLKSRKG